MSPVDELLNMPVEERTKLPWHDQRLSYVASKLEQQYGLPAGVLRAIKFAENTGLDDKGQISKSNNDSTAQSRVGAQGIMQIMPATQKLQKGAFKHNPLDPIESLDAAARYMKHTLTKQYKGNVVAAIADYNGGPTQAKYVLKGKKPAAKETANYLKKVEAFFSTEFKE